MTPGERRWVGEALEALSHRNAVPLRRAEGDAPACAGLYAIHAAASVWRELGLGKAPDERPLYVGKAENSLISRDLDTHFGNGRRRSLAALLHDALGLRGMPRNPVRRTYFANFGLSPEHDELLTAWMRKRLKLAVWPKPAACATLLLTIERALLTRLQPPLNLRDVVTRWSTEVAAARKVMADEARAWASPRRGR